MIPNRAKNLWRRFFLTLASRDSGRRYATRLAALGVPAYRGRVGLAWLHSNGYIAASADLSRRDLRLGKNVFIGERVVCWRQSKGALLELGDAVELHPDCVLEAFEGGAITIGTETKIQSRCYFISAVAPINIGRRVQIAPLCGFYSYDHGIAGDEPICNQALESKGPINIHDDAWLGFNVVVLSGVTIGRGAVIGAGSVVTRDIPAGAVAAGAPARVLKMRQPSL